MTRIEESEDDFEFLATSEEEDSSLELQALTGQLEALKKLLKQKQDEVNTLHKQQEDAPSPRERLRYEAAQRSLNEKDERIKQLEEFKILYHRSQEQIHELQLGHMQAETEAVEELQLLHAQIDALKGVVRKHEESFRQENEKREETFAAIRHAEADKEDLQQRTQILLYELTTTRAELESLRIQADKFHQAAHEAESRYQSALKEKTDLIDQIERSRQQLLAAKEESRAKDDEIAKANSARDRAKQQFAGMELQLNEAQRQQCHLQTALTDLRRDREGLLRARTNLENDFKRVQQECHDWETKLQQAHEEKAKRSLEIQQHVDKSLQEARQRQVLEGDLEALNTKVLERQIELQTLRDQLFISESQQKKMTQELAGKEQHYDELQKQVNQAKQSHEATQEEMARIRRLLETRDTELQTAHQHLAKKVKETARISERLDDTQGRIQQFEHAAEELHRKYRLLEEEIEKSRKREKESEERAQQRILEAMAAAARWEAEYTRMHGQWQQTEESNKKLKELEAKHKQVSGILANLGQFFNAPVAEVPSVIPAPQISIHMEEPVLYEPQAVGELLQHEEQDLFVAAQPQKRAKRNLFDL